MIAVKESASSKALVTKASVASKISAVKNSVTSKSTALMAASRARTNSALQPLHPYYMKVHNGVVHIVARVGNTFVLIQAKATDICRGLQARVVDSVASARAAIERFTSPYVNRLISF